MAVMNLTEKDKEGLRRILEYEDTADRERYSRFGWTWEKVSVWPATLNRLIQIRLLEVVSHTNSYRGMKLTEEGRAVAQNLLAQSQKPHHEPQDEILALPDDLFEDIIGHDEVKELLGACLLAERPVHVLLAGPPALAKSLFLWDIERAGGERAIWLVGSATSKAGLWDLVAERQPKVLLIDELDKMNAADTAALLSMMEGGRLVRAKKGRELNLSHPLWVVAATNRLDMLSPELRSRFAIRKLEPYSRGDFLTVVSGVLVRREKASPELADEIAQRLDGRTQDVRDAIRAARLAPQLGVEKAIKLLVGKGG